MDIRSVLKTKPFSEYRYVRDLSTGKYSSVALIESGDGARSIIKMNDTNLFPVEGEVEFLKTSPVSPELQKFSVEEGWILMEYIDGQTGTTDTVDPSIYFEKIGRLTSQIHRIKSSSYVRYGSGGQRLVYSSYSRLLGEMLDKYFSTEGFIEYMGLDKTAIDAIRSTAESYLSERAVLTHGDLHPGNCIISGDAAYLIDPSTERYMDPHWDYCMMKWQAMKYKNPSKNIETFREAYEYPLLADSSVEVTLTDIMIELLLDYSNFIGGGRGPYRPESFDRLLQRVHSI